MQVTAFLLLLACLAFHHAQAAGPGTTPVAVAPAGGKHHGIQLRAETVDVAIKQENGQLWADTAVWLRLSNPATQTMAVDLAVPGPALAALSRIISPTLPDDIKLTVEDEAQVLQPAKGGMVVPIEIRGQGKVSVRVSYRQALPEVDGLAYYAYPLSVADQWSGTPESLRVSVKFDGVIPAEQILGQAPPADEYDGQTLTWQWSGKDAKDNVWLAFMTPDWWAGLTAARKAAGSPDAGPDQRIALSRLYQHLAALPRLPFRPDIDLYSRYFPAAVGALQATTEPANATGQAAIGAGSQSTDTAGIHAMLAELYQQQADRLGENAGDLYLQLAATEAETALTLGAKDQTLKDLAGNAYRQLAARAGSGGNQASAGEYLARLAALEPSQQAGAGAEQQRAARLQVAAQQVAHGDLQSARCILAETYGQDTAQVSGAAPPLANQAVVAMETRPKQRTIRLTLGDYREPVAVNALLDSAAVELQAVHEAKISYGTDWLEIALPYAQIADLANLQRRLAAALPADPELALLATALQSDQTTLEIQETGTRRAALYTERADLEAARKVWEERADRLAAAASVAEEQANKQADDTQPAVQLARLQHILWTADAANWRALAEASRAEYSVHMEQAGLSRAWVVPGGSSRVMTAESSAWRYERLLAVVVASTLLVALAAYVVWRWL
jgi:hypothetical protein